MSEKRQGVYEKENAILSYRIAGGNCNNCNSCRTSAAGFEFGKTVGAGNFMRQQFEAVLMCPTKETGRNQSYMMTWYMGSAYRKVASIKRPSQTLLAADGDGSAYFTSGSSRKENWFRHRGMNDINALWCAGNVTVYKVKDYVNRQIPYWEKTGDCSFWKSW